MLAKIIAWLRQPTTIGGFSVLFATIGGLLQHLANPATGITGSQAIIPLIGAVTAIAMQDNTAGQAAAVKIATEAMGAASNTLLNTAATVAKRTTPLLLVVGVGLLVSGCASQNSVLVAGTNYAVTTVAGAEAALTAAEQVARAYVILPLCPQPAPTLCSVAATSAQIKALAAKADADLTLAKAGAVTVAALVADISALASAVPAVKTQT